MANAWVAGLMAIIACLVFGQAAMAQTIELSAHPRLYLSEKEIARLKQPENSDLLKSASEMVAAKDAESFLASPVVPFDPNTHNSLLIRARGMQGRVITLLVRWKQTGEEKYRKAAIEHVREMGRWEYWGWDSWRAGNRRPDAEYDLSYGENAATLAIAYDWLHSSLTAQEKAEFVEIGRKWVIAPFLKFTEGDGPRPGWFGNPNTNWNSVCAGGAGMLALAMWEDIPEATRVLAIAEGSIKPFMMTLEKTAGGWPEGLGYWNYGMRYAFMYLLSWEHATGRKHPLMELKGTRQTLSFPLDFSPNGVPCSFGDVPSWNPMPFHFAAAERLDAADVLAGIDPYMAGWKKRPVVGWMEAAELLLLYPRTQTATKPAAVERNVAKLYSVLDWGVLADRLPGPTMYLAAHGGTTKLPHSHLDLLSFFAVVGDEAMITSLGNAEYLDTTFGPRRWELFEMTPAAKNTILINGVGITVDSSVTTEIVQGKNWKGLRIDATEAMGKSRGEPAATFCGRLFVMLEGKGFLILDRVELPHPGRVESRMYTLQKAEFAPTSVLLKGAKQRMRAIWACDVPAILLHSEAALTKPTETNPIAMRWCTKERSHTAVTMATLLLPGEGQGNVEIAHEGEGFLLKLRGETWQEEIRVDGKLH